MLFSLGLTESECSRPKSSLDKAKAHLVDLKLTLQRFQNVQISPGTRLERLNRQRIAHLSKQIEGTQSAISQYQSTYDACLSRPAPTPRPGPTPRPTPGPRVRPDRTAQIEAQQEARHQRAIDRQIAVASRRCRSRPGFHFTVISRDPLQYKCEPIGYAPGTVITPPGGGGIPSDIPDGSGGGGGGGGSGGGGGGGGGGSSGGVPGDIPGGGGEPDIIGGAPGGGSSGGIPADIPGGAGEPDIIGGTPGSGVSGIIKEGSAEFFRRIQELGSLDYSDNYGPMKVVNVVGECAVR